MESHSMMLSPKAKVIVVGLGMVLVSSIVIVSILRESIINKPEYTVSDVGVGRVSYTPDTAEVTFGIQVSKAESAQVALKEITKLGTEIASALEAFNIPTGDIDIQNYSIQPYYDWSEERGSYISGYDANQQYLVTLRNVTAESNNVQKLIDAVTEAGSSQVVSVNFTIDDIESYKQEAKVLALKAATENAKRTADSLDVDLGEITGWWYNTVLPNGDMYYGEKGGAMMEESTGNGFSIIGEKEVVIEASVNYKLR
jgi:uncharacterized protein YggE